MLVEELFERLRNFQDLLIERVAIEEDIRELPKSIIAQEEVLVRARKGYTEKTARFAELGQKLGQLRIDLADVVAHKEKAEQQMDAISSPREFEALNKEITDAGTREDGIRKELKREEYNYQEAEQEMNDSKTLVESQEEEISQKRDRIKNEESSMLKRIDELKKDESKLTDGIDPEIVYKFDRIIRSKQGIGIVPVKGVVCTGCSMILPAQFVNDVRQGNKVIFCPYCSRILFYQESDESHDTLLADIESGSLADLDDFGDDQDDDFDEDDDQDKDGISGQDD